jgi:DNA mismatch repair ATPase MutS
MQAGLCVPASQFSASVSAGVFTHFRREEDRDLRSGKLNEELSRMSELIGRLRPNTLLLMNESFAATNEREGSEIAAEILRALGEHGVRVIFVTHLYAFASARYAEGRADTLFLRAQRESDGGRTFRLEEGEPLPTAYGQDLYRRIFQEAEAETPGAGFRA